MAKKHISVILFILLTFCLAGKASAEESIFISLSPEMLEVVTEADRSQSIYLPGYPAKAGPGDPLLPAKTVNVLLPPDVDLESLRLSVVSVKETLLEGSYDIKACGPYMPLNGTGRMYWGEGKKIYDGRNQNVYAKDVFYPDWVARMLPSSQMRKWVFAKVEFRPLQYNPVSGKLKLIQHIQFEIHFDRLRATISEALLQDCALDHLAPGLFHNYESGKQWYVPSTPQAETDGFYIPRYDYVIIISSSLYNSSNLIPSFILHKRSRGHNVLVVDDTTFLSSSGPPPNTRADKIRQWLKDNYIKYGIIYVLLIGDPSPFEDSAGEGDVPMKMCWPRYGASWGQIEVPTDHYFADLTGNWDKDGDQRFGEYVDWDTTGGVDLLADVYVGRIPVYNSDHVALDSILQKIITYQNAADTTWRKSALLPMSFVDTNFDGAALAQEMLSGFLNTKGFSTWTMFQQGSGACSVDSNYVSDQELRGGASVRDRWSANDYGLVCWVGHGNATSASVGYDNCWDGVLMDFTGTGPLDNGHPSLVFQMSCNNGWPENPGNLGTALLKNGSVGTVCSTRESYWGCDGWPNFNGNASSTGFAYEYMERLSMDYAAGPALYQGKWAVEPRVDTGMELVNMYDHNLYGDPTVSLADNVRQKISLGEAVDNHLLSHVSGGNVIWAGLSGNAFYYDGDGAKSGGIDHSQSSWMESSVRGPATLSFYWKVSSEVGFDHLDCYLDSSKKSAISGEAGWTQKVINVPSGEHSVRWVYAKDPSISKGSDCGWVDRVVLTPTQMTSLPSLLGFFPFEGDAKDKSGLNHHGTIYNSITSVEGPEEDKAFLLDGSASSIQIPLNINPSQYPKLTMGAWVRPISVNPIRQVLSCDNGGYDRSLGIDNRSGGSGWSAFCGSGGVLGSLYAAEQYWTLVAVVYDQAAQTVKLYAGGNTPLSKTGVLGEGSAKMSIGKNPAFGDFFHGDIDNVFFFSDALSDDQISFIRYFGKTALKSAVKLGYVKRNDAACGGKEPCYASIQEAVNSAATGTTIKVTEGTYAESITLNASKSVTLQGGWDASFASQAANKTFIKAPSVPLGSLTLQMINVLP